MSVGKFLNYDDLIEPKNPDYQWNAHFWQPLCYYCAQPIRGTFPGAGYKQRVSAGWEHTTPVFITDIDVEKHPEMPNLKIYQRSMNGSHWYCNPLRIRPSDEIDEPRCHICSTQTNVHGGVCSAAGKPSYKATTMSQKEEELIRILGWTNRSETVVKEKERVTFTEGIGTMVVGGALLGVLAWMTGSLPRRRLDVNQTP